MAGKREQERILAVRPARYRPTVWAVIHYAFWTVLIFALWPAAAILAAVKRVRRYE